MGNTLPKHQFYFNKDFYYVTMVLHDLDYDIGRHNWLNYYAKDKNNNPITFSNCPDLRGSRPIVYIPKLIRDRLIASRKEFKVILLQKRGIKPFLVAFSEDSNADLTDNIPNEYRNYKEYNWKFIFNQPKSSFIKVDGKFRDDHYAKITGIGFEEGLLLPGGIYNLMTDFLEGATSVVLYHNVDNVVGGLNIVL
jgi:hypothetical protein